jgi:hypothetical protein
MDVDQSRGYKAAVCVEYLLTGWSEAMAYLDDRATANTDVSGYRWRPRTVDN